VPLFAAKAPCLHCGASVKQPHDPAYYLCPACQQPGPWASQDQIAAWQGWKAEEDRKRAEELELQRQAQLAQVEARRRELEAAASLATLEVPGFVAQKGELVHLSMPAKLAEWGKPRGHYESGPSLRGVSFKIPGMKSMRGYYGGMSQRKYVQSEEGWMLKDEGTALITSKRIVFRGQQKAVEWAYSKLVGIDRDPTNDAFVLQVSNRQKAHVVMVDDGEVFEVAATAAIKAFQEG